MIMKNMMLVLLSTLLLAKIAQAQEPTQQAYPYLVEQDSKTCFAKKLIETFMGKQMIGNETPRESNFNGSVKTNVSMGGNLDGQLIQSINRGYWVRIRMLDSGLNGEVLEVSFAHHSCTPTKAYTSRNGEYIQIQIEGGKCREKRIIKTATPTPAPMGPPPPPTAEEEFCTLLKGMTS